MPSSDLICGDCLDVLAALPDNYADAIVTDPPAGISFMGKAWDHDKGGRDHWIAWMQAIAAECLRVLKPGGHAIVWALPRTSHWTATAWENAGFECRDRIVYCHGQGFPKSLDVSKAIDEAAGAQRVIIGYSAGFGKGSTFSSGFQSEQGYRPPYTEKAGQPAPITTPATDAGRQWAGWGTTLKPAIEDWWLFRRPLEGTVAANVQKCGTGALNIDATRIDAGAETWTREPGSVKPNESIGTFKTGTRSVVQNTQGRWPANLVHSGEPEILACFPQSAGQLADVSDTAPSAKTSHVYGAMKRVGEATQEKRYTQEGGTNFAAKPGARRADKGSAARYFTCCPPDNPDDEPDLPLLLRYQPKPSQAERNYGCDNIPAKTAGEATGGRKEGSAGLDSPRAGAGRTSGGRNAHPTLKGIALMRWLCRLVTPPGGLIIDPFCGSGSTGIAAMLEDFSFLGIDQEQEWITVAEARIVAWMLRDDADAVTGGGR